MFGIAALLTVFLPWLLIPLLAVLAWRLRRRRWRALLALGALVLLLLLNSRELLYLFGVASVDAEEASGLTALRQRIVSQLEGFAWQVLALAAVAAAALAWPLPPSRGLRVLAVVVVGGLGVSAFLVWSFTGLRFN